ncbi:MAG: pectate lyase [Candidatus Latescibacterota bacterium]|nr:pectate lyase [Candidatus Latescibacterota bacterium]MEE2725609.1 pectate lyase [Candidatus Latescibacterota bacterium]
MSEVRGQQLAFPRAEGFGRFSLGGRGGKVLFVTNLHDSGPGSLRAAIEADYPRIVVFKVSGTIELQSHLRIRHPRITIAGQTAPGDGICLRRYPLVISADDVIVRFLRVRLGDEAGRKMDGIDVSDAENVIVDHCSVSWTLDEAVNTYHGSKNITIQWCLISESLHDSPLQEGHGFAASLGGFNTSYHHNLLANNAGRNPSIAGEEDAPTINLDFRNNVIFNWGHRTLDGRPRSINVVNNYYKAGPASRRDHIVKMQTIYDGSFGRWYIDGNVMVDTAGKVHRSGIVRIDSEDVPLDSALVEAPVDFAPVQTETAEETYERVLDTAGATLPRRDAHDVRIIGEVRSGKTTYGNGIISTQTDVGGWTELRSTDPPEDADADGMPDAWERPFTEAGDLSLESAQDADGDGYTNVEEYLNGTNPTEGD